MTRAEHLTWCKARALVYVRFNDVNSAWASFASDMAKHKELADHPALPLGHLLFFGGHLNSLNRMKEYIEGFN